MSKYQGIFSISGAILSTLVLGNILPFSSLSSYILSDNNPNIFPRASLFYFSIALFTANVINIFSMTIVKLTGAKTLSMIGFVLIGGGFSIFYFKTNLFFHLIAMSVIGLGVGIQFNPLMRNVWLYYPNSKGLVSLVFILLYGLSSVLFSLFIEFMFGLYYIDGELETAESKKEEILSRFFMITLAIILSIGALVAFLLSNHLPEKNEQEFNIKQEMDPFIQKGMSINDEDTTSMSNYNEMEFVNKEPIKSTFWNRFCSLLISFRFWCIVSLFFLSFIFSFLFTHSIRFLGIHNAFDSYIIVSSIIIYPSVITISKLILCLLYEKISFKIMFCFILLLQIGLGIVIPFVNNEYLFITFVILGGFCYAGNSSLLSPLITKIYGMEHSFELSGLAIALSSLSVFVVPFASLFYGQIIEIELFIKYLFFGSSAASLIAFILCLAIQESTFDFSNRFHKLSKGLNASNTLKDYSIQDVKSERNSQ